MTNNIKQERRYRRTEALILNGLTTLLQQKSIKEITVRELADLVDINRSTFYLHYTDIYDLLEKTEQRLLQQLLDAVNQNWTLPETPKNFFAFLEQAFTILSENAQLCSALIGPNGDIAFLRNIEKMIREKGVQTLRSFAPGNCGNRICNMPFPSPSPAAWD
ncbi:MAG: TetR/AcrR family transcriptional regulator [Ruminococcus callidus]